jgi:hypothetical protein
MRIQTRTLNDNDALITDAYDIVNAHNTAVNPNGYSFNDKDNVSSYYIISVTGTKNCYYTLYSYNNHCISPNAKPWQYITNLSTDLLEAVNKICTGRGKIVRLEIQDNFNINNIAPTCFQFGKYAGQPISEVYNRDPKYIIWAAFNMTAKNKRQQQVVETLQLLKDAHFQMVTEENLQTCTSNHMHEIGQRVNVNLQITSIIDPKPDPLTGLTPESKKYRAQDNNGNLYQFFSKAELELNQSYALRGTTKRHFTTLGKKYTSLNRVTIL